MAYSQTNPSIPLLSEAARHVVMPKGIKTTAWPRVEAQCAEMGVVFDPWQQGIGRIALGKRANGKYAATVGGIVLSIPRQVGKTFFVGMVVIALCILHPGLTVIWTAHRTRTTTQTFRSLQGMARKKQVAKHIAHNGVRTANGEQEIKFANGSIIMFGAREQGFGRGFDEVDIEVFDEAQILTSKALEDMVAATNQSRQPSGALLFFMGTPPRPIDPGEEFTNRRAKALSGKGDNMAYIEFSADTEADLEDKAQWSKANPSFPSRTPLESMERMREQLTDDDSFRREALGIWDEELGRDTPIPAGAWASLSLDEVPAEWPLISLGLDMNPERTKVSIGVAARSPQGVHLEIAEDTPFTESGSEALVNWIYERAGRRIPVVMDAYSPIRSLEAALKAKKMKVFILGPAELSQACGGFYDAVTKDKSVTHYDQEALNASLAGAVRQKFGDGGAWKWNRKGFDIDLTQTMSITCAHFGAVKFAKPRREQPAESADRRLIVMGR